MKFIEQTLLDAVTTSRLSLAFNVENYKKIGLQFLARNITSGNGNFTVDGTIDGTHWVQLAMLIKNVSNSSSQNITRVDAIILSQSTSGSASPSRSPSASISPSASVSLSVSPSASRSPSASSSTSFSRSPSASISPSASVSRSPSASISPSASVSISPSASVSPSASASLSQSASVSPSASISPSSSASPSVSPSPSTFGNSALVWLDPFLALKALRVKVGVTGDGEYSAFAIACE